MPSAGTGRRYALDVSKVDASEIRDAKRLLRRMSRGCAIELAID